MFKALNFFLFPGYHREGSDRIPEMSDKGHSGADGDQRRVSEDDRPHHRRFHPQPTAAGTDIVRGCRKSSPTRLVL